MIDVMEEIEPIGELYTSGDFSLGLEKIKKLWDSIPEPKEDTLNSYMLVEYGVAFSLKNEDLDLAWEWAMKAPAFIEDRLDSGAVEFLIGKVAFERGDLELAKEKFLIANEKSEGRAFISKDPKYKKLIK